ncbi:hypothetical protein P7B02_03425 [Caulobacter segnis]|uniref:hypothetical protein n=1 Tax=Caulobacter segnis TaxID=88688 RepID=UPI00240F8D72|nr:hypothetical protein [Caulobacter segnis]MDG2520582.1 hypothetical protein [Caulobacter segnis]
MIWGLYDDRREHALVGEDGVDANRRSDLARYAAFLDTDLPYSWSRDNFVGIAGLGVLVPLSLGLLWPLDHWIKARIRRADDRFAAEGEVAAWPFMNAADFMASSVEPHQ